MHASEFVRFGVSHAAAIFVTLAATCLLQAAIARSSKYHAARTAARLLLAFAASAIVLSEIAGQYWRIRGGIWNIQADLPLHLCDIAGVAVVWVALSRAASPQRAGGPHLARVGELAYFWTLAGSSQALLTPDLGLNYPHFAFWEFFVSHGAAWAVVVALAGGGWLPVRRGSYLPSWWITLAVGAVVGIINIPIGANYMYTCGPPGQASVYDYFGPWPLSLVSLSAIGLLLFWLCERLYFAVWMRRDRNRGSSAARSE